MEELSALYETSTAVLSTLNLTELLDTVLKKLMVIARLDRAGVFLVNKKGRYLSLIHATGIDEETLKRLKDYRVPIDKRSNIIARAAQSKKPILVEDTDSIKLNRKNPLLFTFKPKAFIIVPLTVRNEVIGIMVGDNSSNKDFIKEIDKELLTSFANHIAMAIENANLYKRVQSSEKKYRQIVENINEGILVLGEGGTIIFSNKKMNELMKEELKGLNIFELVRDKDDRKKLLSLIMKNFKGLKVKEEIGFQPRSGGGVIVPTLMSSVPILDDDNKTIKGSLALITDLTQQKALERKLLQAQKLESIGTMAGGIAHDFNNILTGILGFTTLMKEKASDRPDLLRFIDIIENSSSRAAELVRKMLIFSRNTASPEDHEACNPKKVAEEVLSLIKSSFPKNIEVFIEGLKEPPSIRCSSSKLQQIIMNLCINARDAMPDGGKITIKIEECPRDHLPILLKKRAKDEAFLKITVSDTGTGISPDVMDRIFDPFFTTKEVGKGSGLGLAVVYGIMEGIGGLVDVKSKVGIGTSFYLYFPIQKEELEKLDKDKGNTRFFGNETVLVVDDEEMIRALASEILSPYGYKVIEAKDGEEAVSIYNSMPSDVDLVLMDVIMPKMDGIKAAQKILSLDPMAKILFCSGYSSASELSKLSKGSKNFPQKLIKKPFLVENLIMAIREALDTPSAK